MKRRRQVNLCDVQCCWSHIFQFLPHLKEWHNYMLVCKALSQWKPIHLMCNKVRPLPMSILQHLKKLKFIWDVQKYPEWADTLSLLKQVEVLAIEFVGSLTCSHVLLNLSSCHQLTVKNCCDADKLQYPCNIKRLVFEGCKCIRIVQPLEMLTCLEFWSCSVIDVPTTFPNLKTCFIVKTNLAYDDFFVKWLQVHSPKVEFSTSLSLPRRIFYGMEPQRIVRLRDQRLIPDPCHENLHYLEMWGQSIKQTDIESLARLPKLEKLFFIQCKFHSSKLNFRCMQTLQMCWFQNCQLYKLDSRLFPPGCAFKIKSLG